MIKNGFLFVLLSAVLVLGSCHALHRGIPKACRHDDGRGVTAEETTTAAESAKLIRGEGATPAELHETAILAVERMPEQVAAIAEVPDTDIEIRRRIFVNPNDDTVIVSSRTLESDQEMIDQALESERVARSAYHFSFLPLFSLLFFPTLFIGIIVTLIKLSRFNKDYEYVTEKGLDYERRAKRTLIVSSVVPIVALILFVLVLLLLF